MSVMALASGNWLSSPFQALHPIPTGRVQAAFMDGQISAAQVLGWALLTDSHDSLLLPIPWNTRPAAWSTQGTSDNLPSTFLL
jgi:hypothetical protein